MGNSSITTLIVNFNSSQWLDSCLKGLAEQQGSRVVVIDNGSDTADKLNAKHKTMELRSGTFLELPRNVGFGAAINWAVKLINPRPEEILFILNPDTVLAPDAVDLMQKEIVEGGSHLVSPLIMKGASLTGSKVWYSGGSIDFSAGRTLLRTHEASKVGLPFEVAFVTGAALMLKATTFLKLGGFDEDFFLYWEDADLSLRASEAGLRLTCVPRAVVGHQVGGSRKAGRRSVEFFEHFPYGRLRLFRTRVSLWRMFWGRGLLISLYPFAEALFSPPRLGNLAAAAKSTWRGILSWNQAAPPFD